MPTAAPFQGSVPHVYDHHLGPFLFDWSAERLAERVRVPPGGRVLEVACGTGIATEALRRALPPGVGIVATDLSPAMLEKARAARGGLPAVRFAQADAQALPFPVQSVDAVVCQFGLMFFPDPVEALREAVRVLKPGGQLLFGVWGSMDDNPAVGLVHEVLGGFFPDDPPRFLETPFGLHRPAVLRRLFEEAGARQIEVETCDHLVELPSAHGPAQGLVRGTPGVLEIEARGGSPDVVAYAAETALEARFGREPFRAPLRALFVSARR